MAGPFRATNAILFTFSIDARYTKSMVSKSTILEHVIEPKRGDLSSDLAQYFLTLDFPQTDHARYQMLSEKAQAGALTDEERADLDDFLNVNDFLMIIQAKARASLAHDAG